MAPKDCPLIASMLNRSCLAPRLMLAWLFLSMTACAATKQTWQDWQSAQKHAHIPHHIESFSTAENASPRATIFAPGYAQGDDARTGEHFDLAMRNPDFPRTHIKTIHINLTGPDHWVRLQWSGPSAELGHIGPWHSTPGRGQPDFDCDDAAQSNTVDSFCASKGTFKVAGFADHLTLTPQCTYATWILHAPRFLAMHGHTDLPRKPASPGCVRLPVEAAKLIHNNSIAGVTTVIIGGKWVRP